MTKEESRAIKAEAFRQEQEIQKQVEIKNEEIKRLNNIIQEMQSNFDTYNSKSDDVNIKLNTLDNTINNGLLSDDKVNILEYMANNKTTFTNDLMAKLHLSSVKFRYLIDDLKIGNFIESNSSNTVELTHKGREYLVTNGII